MRSAGNRSNAECRMRNAFTEAFTPLGAGLIMEETRLGLVRKSKITNCATPCNTIASIRSFLRGNEGGRSLDSKTVGELFVAFVTFCKALCLDSEAGGQNDHRCHGSAPIA